MQPAIVMGIMSGTSVDGADFALCSISDACVELLALWRADFPRALRARLHAAARGAATSWELAQLHHDLGRFYAVHAGNPPGTRKWRPQFVGLHGQTVHHNPAPHAPATLQIGEPAYLVEKLCVPVVSNFRAADMAAGGQGAPLATAFHVRVFGRHARHVCVNNLGGISNVTSIDWRRGKRARLMAFDTGPANVLIDLAMRHFTCGRLTFDRDGHWAARGRVNEAWLRRWMRHLFFRKAPPKSTGRELFGEPFFKKALALASEGRGGFTKFDLVRTFTELTARSIAENYRRHLKGRPDTVVLCGGGAANPVLVDAIRNCLRDLEPSMEVKPSEGWPLQSVEPAAFAYLAWLRMLRRSGNEPETTGARSGVLCGQITG